MKLTQPEDDFGLITTSTRTKLTHRDTLMQPLRIQEELQHIFLACTRVIFISANPDADFLEHELANQIGRQFGAILCTLVVSVISGFGTGKLIALLEDEEKSHYKDNSSWKAEYFEASHQLLEPSTQASIKECYLPLRKLINMLHFGCVTAYRH
jgi:hypothetical protein